MYDNTWQFIHIHKLINKKTYGNIQYNELNNIISKTKTKKKYIYMYKKPRKNQEKKTKKNKIIILYVHMKSNKLTEAVQLMC